MIFDKIVEKNESLQYNITRTLVREHILKKGGETIDRSRQARWDEEHLRTATTKLKTSEYEMFKEQCNAIGETPYSQLLKLIRDWELDNFCGMVIDGSATEAELEERLLEEIRAEGDDDDDW